MRIERIKRIMRITGFTGFTGVTGFVLAATAIAQDWQAMIAQLRDNTAGKRVAALRALNAANYLPAAQYAAPLVTDGYKDIEPLHIVGEIVRDRARAGRIKRERLVAPSLRIGRRADAIGMPARGQETQSRDAVSHVHDFKSNSIEPVERVSSRKVFLQVSQPVSIEIVARLHIRQRAQVVVLVLVDQVPLPRIGQAVAIGVFAKGEIHLGATGRITHRERFADDLDR